MTLSRSRLNFTINVTVTCWIYSERSPTRITHIGRHHLAPLRMVPSVGVVSVRTTPIWEHSTVIYREVALPVRCPPIRVLLPYPSVALPPCRRQPPSRRATLRSSPPVPNSSSCPFVHLQMRFSRQTFSYLTVNDELAVWMTTRPPTVLSWLFAPMRSFSSHIHLISTPSGCSASERSVSLQRRAKYPWRTWKSWIELGSVAFSAIDSYLLDPTSPPSSRLVPFLLCLTQSPTPKSSQRHIQITFQVVSLTFSFEPFSLCNELIHWYWLSSVCRFSLCSLSFLC